MLAFVNDFVLSSLASSVLDVVGVMFDGDCDKLVRSIYLVRSIFLLQDISC